MLNTLAKQSSTGDIFVNLAKQYLANDEWGMAKICIEKGLEKGIAEDSEQAQKILDEVCRRLGVCPER